MRNDISRGANRARPVTPPQHPFEARRAEVERMQAVQDDLTAVRYRLAFQGAGEQLVEVHFPCRFIDEPFVSSGFSLAEDAVLVDGNYPWASAGAMLLTEEIAGHVYYVGAQVVVVVGGDGEQEIIVHVGFEAKAIIGPVEA